ncbi:DUF397 domain-containing protein [Streptomyces sp. NPDC004959]|uniref:DUF397 domain-containing protein n=1 Tax=unclassified Streptomyces TaxID=2593676 RepID=UPI0004CC7D67|nr:DUF397 domain-containing protein [Streptomyces sp. NRRL F-5630]
MHHTDLTALSWRKSTYSNSDGGACVEVSDDLPALVPVRDSKRPSAAHLVFPAAHWSAFVEMVKQGA